MRKFIYVIQIKSDKDRQECLHIKETHDEHTERVLRKRKSEDFLGTDFQKNEYTSSNNKLIKWFTERFIPIEVHGYDEENIIKC